jgi:hypothetical protein
MAVVRLRGRNADFRRAMVVPPRRAMWRLHHRAIAHRLSRTITVVGRSTVDQRQPVAEVGIIHPAAVGAAGSYQTDFPSAASAYLTELKRHFFGERSVALQSVVIKFDIIYVIGQTGFAYFFAVIRGCYAVAPRSW